MLTILIPTAKEMLVPSQTYPHHFSTKSATIIEELSQFQVQELAACYKISELAAQKEYQRIRSIQQNTAPAYPALDLFNGLMYRHIDRDLSTSEQVYLDKSVFITSALYGIIPARQAIAEHRLDFQTKLKIQGQSLKAYWRDDFDRFVANKKQAISLLSSEFEQVFSKQVRDKFISVKFMEEKAGQLKTHLTISKKARGAFLSRLIHNQIEDVDKLKELTFNGFVFQQDLSTTQQLVYVKKEAK